MKRKPLGFVLLLLLAFSVSSLGSFAMAYAEAPASDMVSRHYELDDSRTVRVDIPSSLQNSITEDGILDILNCDDLEDGAVITIHHAGSVSSLPSGYHRTARGLQSFVVTSYIGKSEEYAAESIQYTSVAKGMEMTVAAETRLATAISAVLSGTPLASGQLSTSFTATTSISLTFSGPPESSPHNSRIFYVQITRVNKDWVQQEYTYGGALCGTATGTSSVPVGYVLYSVDVTIS